MDETAKGLTDQEDHNRMEQDAPVEESRTPEPSSDAGSGAAPLPRTPGNTKPGSVDAQAVKNVAAEEVPLIALVEVLSPTIDSILDALVFSAGSQLSDPGSDSLLAVGVKVVLYGVLRVGNQMLRDENGSTRWIWKSLFQCVGSFFKALVSILFKRGNNP